jgi:hypothetical protein
VGVSAPLCFARLAIIDISQPLHITISRRHHPHYHHHHQQQQQQQLH